MGSMIKKAALGLVPVMLLLGGCGSSDIITLGNGNGDGDCRAVIKCEDLPSEGDYSYEELVALGVVGCQPEPVITTACLEDGSLQTLSNGVPTNTEPNHPSCPQPNTAPAFTQIEGITQDGAGVNHLALSTNENENLSLTLPSEDPNGDTITYVLSGEDASYFTLSEEGTLSLKAGMDYESPKDGNGDNTYEVSITIEDGKGGSQSLLVTLSIQDRIENTAANPVVITACEGGSLLTYVDGLLTSSTPNHPDCQPVIPETPGTDPEPEPEPVITTACLEDGSLATYEDGVLSFTQPNHSSCPQPGITPENGAPHFTGYEGNETVNLEVNEGTTDPIITLTATDPNEGDSLTYSLGGEDGHLFTLNEGETITFSTTPDYENPTDSDGNNIYSIQAKVSDQDGLSALQQFLITVLNLDENPPITLELNVPITVYPGDTLTILDEETNINVVHTLDEEIKVVTLLSGSAELLRGDYYLNTIAPNETSGRVIRIKINGARGSVW